MSSELARRAIASVIAVPVVIGAAYVGDAALAALLSVTAALAAWEFFRIARAAGGEPLSEVGIVAAACIPLLAHAARLGVVSPSIVWGAMLVIALLGATIWARGPLGHPLGAAALTLLGVAYAGGMLSFGYALRYHQYVLGSIDRAAGAALLMLPIVLTWTTDTGAYFVGRAAGRHKLAPAVSPSKTIEGSLGGILLSMLACWLYVTYVLVPHASLALSTTNILIVGVVISVAVQTGDLAESMIKREAGVKDSSRLIPGHGGVLDRIDGLLFALPTAYWLLGVLRVLPVMR